MPYPKQVELQENVALAPYTTLNIGGPARFFAAVHAQADLLEAIHFARANRLPIFTLGGGSNLVVPDHGFPGLVLHIDLPESIVRTDLHDKVLFDVSAGTGWDALVRHICEQNLCGMECLAGIPGLTGGAPIQNIGAYGQEVSETIDQVTAVDLETLAEVTFSNAECAFAYRRSLFNSTQRNRFIVTSVRFRMDPAATPSLDYADLASLRATSPTPLDVYHAVRAIRDRKGMLIDPAHPHPDSRSAGSFFKNPVVPASALGNIAEVLSLTPAEIPHWPADSGRVKLSAAWLIERAGFPKGFRRGPAGISTRHTLALVNAAGNATCAQLLALRDLIILTVEDRFGITLHQEPVLLEPASAEPKP